MIVFLDLETTGLNERDGSILELAAIVVDDDLRELARFETLVRPLAGEAGALSPFILDMHSKSGLLADIFEDKANTVLRDTVPRRHQAEQLALAWLDEVAPAQAGTKPPPLGGSSVHFDRAWLKEHMPLLEKRFAYRNIDVSTFLECSNRWTPELTRSGMDPAAPKTPHRAMPDIEFSLERLRAYKRELFDPRAAKQVA